MPIDLRTSLPATAVAIVCIGVVVIRVAIAPGPTPRPLASDTERLDLAQNISINEVNWVMETTQNFPNDHWSQRDDFHGREYKRVMELANQHHVRIEDVLRAVDEDIHTRRAPSFDAPDQRNARAVPCKPRPFYD